MSGSRDSRRISRSWVALLLPWLSACMFDPPYVPFDAGAGFSDYPLADGLHGVRFSTPPMRFDAIDPILKAKVLDFALLRSAEVAEREGYAYFCLASLQSFEHTGFGSYAYASYTLRLLEERPPRLAVAAKTRPALYDCYESAATETTLRRRHELPRSWEEALR